MPTRCEELLKPVRELTPHIFNLILLIPGSSWDFGCPEVYRGFRQSPWVNAGIVSAPSPPPPPQPPVRLSPDAFLDRIDAVVIATPCKRKAVRDKPTDGIGLLD